MAKAAAPQETMKEEATVDVVLTLLEEEQQTARLVVTWATIRTTIRTTWRRSR